MNIFEFTKGGIAKKVEKDPYLANVTLSRSLPGKIIVKVDERIPTAVVPYADKYVVIDSSGYVLEKTTEKQKLTILEGMKIRSMDVGSPIRVKEMSRLNETLKLLKQMKKNNLFFKKVNMSNGVIKAYIYDSLVAKGTPKNLMAVMKNGDLQKVLYTLYKKNVKNGTLYIDGSNYCYYNPKQ